MLNRLGFSDAPFASASMASSQKEQLWDSDSAAGLQSFLFCHQDPTVEEKSTSFRSFFPPAEYPYFPLGLVMKREENVASAAGQIDLDLGQRTYFSSSSSSGDDVRRLFSRQKGGGGGGGGGVLSPSHEPSRCQCQVEGCKSDLSGAKHYHRRHKVCDFHSKATVVIAHGLQQRFCQQCSRFHVLAEFDEAKRSCRKRLADHNRRRRKPQLISAAASTKHDADCSTSMITPRTSGMDEQGDRREDEVVVGALLLGEQEKFSHRRRQLLQQQCFSSLTDQCKSRFLHHQNTWSSSPNEASMSMGGGPSGHLHLDQSMFELDFI